jgi:SSS family solute:Na+ symporter
MSISIVALVGFYLPFFRTSIGAIGGLLTSTVVTSLWYWWGNPYGIDNMYVALATPVVFIAVERVVELALGVKQPAPAE